jgi:hypothetical protein
MLPFEEAGTHRRDLPGGGGLSAARPAAHRRQPAGCVDRDEVKAPGVGQDLAEQRL